MSLLIAAFSLLIACEISKGIGEDGYGYVPSCVHELAWTSKTLATCTAAGTEEGICSLCGYTTTRDDTSAPALGHNWGAWITTTTPTCIDGEETRTCANDSSHTETRSVAALGSHTPNPETGICDICGDLTYNIGDTGPGGGIIFYIDQNGFTVEGYSSFGNSYVAHYLEAAPANWNGVDDPQLTWALTQQAVPGDATAQTIGAGRKNTALILAQDTNAPAAKACDDYSNNGKADWFLPSKDELNALYTNRSYVGNLATCYYCWYWSSSEDTSDSAWYQYVGNGGQYYLTKYLAGRVRAVRAF